MIDHIPGIVGQCMKIAAHILSIVLIADNLFLIGTTLTFATIWARKVKPQCRQSRPWLSANSQAVWLTWKHQQNANRVRTFIEIGYTSLTISLCFKGNTFLFRSSQQLPCLRLGPLKGFMSWHGAHQGPPTRLVRCFWNYKETRWMDTALLGQAYFLDVFRQ